MRQHGATNGYDLNGHDVGYADGSLSPLAHDDSGDVITRVSAKYGLTVEEAAELIEEIQENSHSGSNSDALKIHRSVKRGIRNVIDSRSLQEMEIKLHCFCLSMGWFNLIDGIDSCRKLADKFKLTKSDLNKHAVTFRDRVMDGIDTIPATSGQRNDKARGTFAKKRMEQMLKRTATFVADHPRK